MSGPHKCGAPDPEEIGVAGWTVLHTAAAAYPNQPTEAQRRHMYNFLTSWSHVYACSICAFHMRQEMKKNPPNVTSKRAVSRYVCQLHNSVNAMLDKPVHDCDPEKVLAFWHPTYPDMDDQPTIEQQLEELKAADRAKGAAQPAAGGGGGGSGWQTPSQRDQHGSSGGGSTDPNDVMKRLKGCQVFCPDKKADV